MYSYRFIQYEIAMGLFQDKASIFKVFKKKLWASLVYTKPPETLAYTKHSTLKKVFASKQLNSNTV